MPTASLQLVPNPPVQYVGTADGLGRPQLVELTTIQFAWGGLIDAVPEELIHLNANYAPGSDKTLCGIDMFGKGGPGWSRRGGVTGPSYNHRPCPECVTAAADLFPGLGVAYDMFKLDWSKS